MILEITSSPIFTGHLKTWVLKVFRLNVLKKKAEVNLKRIRKETNSNDDVGSKESSDSDSQSLTQSAQ